MSTKLLACLICLTQPLIVLASDERQSLCGDHPVTEGMQLSYEKSDKGVLKYEADLRLIFFSGILAMGIAEDFDEIIKRHSDADALVLNSSGGNVYQARGIAAAVLERGLDTYVEGVCNSACTLVFLAGEKRFLVDGATLGWHCYLIGSPLAGQFVDVEAEQAKDLEYFRQRIPDVDFVDQIFDEAATRIWQPSYEFLLEAGVVHAVVEPDWRTYH